MNMDKNLKASQQRAVQYWFVDGLAELSGGVLCLLLALYFVAQQALPASPWIFYVLFIVVSTAAFGIRRLMLRIREHTTYPRTGFVAMKSGWEDRKTLAIMIIFALFLLALNLYLVLSGPQSVVWMPALGGLIFAFVFALAGFQTKLGRFYSLAGFQTKLGRFYSLAAICLLLGVALSLSGLGDLWGVAVLSFFTSLVMFVFGTIARRAYLRQTKTLTEKANES
jgi:hypothetical protein